MESGFIPLNEVPLFKLRGVPCTFMCWYIWNQYSNLQKAIYYVFATAFSLYAMWMVTRSIEGMAIVGGLVSIWALIVFLSPPVDLTMDEGPFPEQLFFENRLSVASCSNRGRSYVWASTLERLEITHETVAESRFQLVKIIFRKKLWQRRIPVRFGIMDSQDLQPLYEWAEMKNIQIDDKTASHESVEEVGRGNGVSES